MWHDVRMLNAATNTLLSLLVLGLLASGFWWLAQRPMFVLKTIRIEGVASVPIRYVNATTIRAVALPRVKGNFFTADLELVRQAFESVPWVRQARVRREWPNVLIVGIEEHRPLGAWGEDGRLLSVKGDVFTANLAEAEEDGPLPVFAGPEGSAKAVVARFHELQTWLQPSGLVPESLMLSERYAWTVKLRDGVVVQLGREQNATALRERIDRLSAIYPQLTALLQNRIESVDMRYPNGLALQVQGLTFATNGKKR